MPVAGVPVTLAVSTLELLDVAVCEVNAEDVELSWFVIPCTLSRFAEIVSSAVSVDCKPVLVVCSAVRGWASMAMSFVDAVP